MPGYSVQTVTIAQSATHSAAFSPRFSSIVGVWAPVVTSCSIFFPVAYEETDPSSANFTRAFQKDGSAQFSWAVGIGSANLNVSEVLGHASFAKIESGVPQAAARTFLVMTKQ